MAAMDLSKLMKKTLEVSRDLTYTYYTHPARTPKPTVILFHGWPDTAHLWSGLINNHLLPNGYGVVAPDCLGYGGTSKPTDPAAYAWSRMTADVLEILDAEGLSEVVSLGHDWGSALCQRLYNLHPSRVIGVAMLNVPYLPPEGQPFDLDAVNAATRKAYGCGVFEYWHFFGLDDDAPRIMDANPLSVYTVAFADPHTWLENWCTPGGMRRYVSEGRTQPVLPFATPEHKADFMTRFGGSGDGGFAAPCCWYRATASSLQAEEEKLVAEDAKTIRVPVLYWGGEQDFVCRPAGLGPSVDAGLLPDLTVVTRKGGHWALLEKPDEFGQDVVGWLQDTFA